MIINCDVKGSMPEWLMGADCKSAGYAYAGSNPARPTTYEEKSLEPFLIPLINFPALK